MFELQAVPREAVGLLRRALAVAPNNPRLLSRLGEVQFERYDFRGAAVTYETLLRLEPGDTFARARLAGCLNELGREAEALAQLCALDDDAAPEALYQRAVALTGLGRAPEAETQLRALLARAPGHRNACGALMRILRKGERWREAAQTCDALARRGVRHAQLLLDWGYALAACGEADSAAALTFDPARLGCLALPPPAPFAEAAEFCAAFAGELTRHPLVLSELGRRDANRGSRRVHQLLGGARPELARGLAASLQGLIEHFVADLEANADGRDDAWLAARPRRARLSCWGLIQRAGEFEAWHSHPAGWLSGVCYLALPAPFSARGDGEGCIEFGPLAALADAGPAPSAALRIAPRVGRALLAPSHYLHRTIPFSAAGERVSFAFDVVPDGP